MRMYDMEAQLKIEINIEMEHGKEEMREIKTGMKGLAEQFKHESQRRDKDNGVIHAAIEELTRRVAGLETTSRATGVAAKPYLARWMAAMSRQGGHREGGARGARQRGRGDGRRHQPRLLPAALMWRHRECEGSAGDVGKDRVPMADGDRDAGGSDGPPRDGPLSSSLHLSAQVAGGSGAHRGVDPDGAPRSAVGLRQRGHTAGARGPCAIAARRRGMVTGHGMSYGSLQGLGRFQLRVERGALEMRGGASRRTARLRG